jgi:hypothetical protein
MKRFLAAVLTAAFLMPALVAPSFAEENEKMKATGEIKKRDDAERDRLYNNALKNTSTDAKSVKVDPWGNAREPAGTAASNSNKK